MGCPCVITTVKDTSLRQSPKHLVSLVACLPFPHSDVPLFLLIFVKISLFARGLGLESGGNIICFFIRFVWLSCILSTFCLASPSIYSHDMLFQISCFEFAIELECFSDLMNSNFLMKKINLKAY